MNLDLSRKFTDYRFNIIAPSDCKNDCSWDYDCAHIEGFPEPHICIHPTLINKYLSTIVAFSNDSNRLSYMESSESLISAEFITIVMLLLLFACVLIIAHATWNHCHRDNKKNKKTMKTSQSCPITDI